MLQGCLGGRQWLLWLVVEEMRAFFFCPLVMELPALRQECSLDTSKRLLSLGSAVVTAGEIEFSGAVLGTEVLLCKQTDTEKNKRKRQQTRKHQQSTASSYSDWSAALERGSRQENASTPRNSRRLGFPSLLPHQSGGHASRWLLVPPTHTYIPV